MSVQDVAAAPNIRWRRSLQSARDEARREGKLVLIYLFHHRCGGSRTMGAATYLNPEVESYIEQHFVPVQFDVLEQPEVERQFNSDWTPTLIVEDTEGREHRRSQGYLDAERFIGEMALAWLKDAIDRRDRETAPERSDEALKRTKNDPAREPEALYWSAVVAYHYTDDRDDLIEGWNRLLERFPQSEWAKRAGYIRQQ
jgi:thioredoxin-related protein